MNGLVGGARDQLFQDRKASMSDPGTGPNEATLSVHAEALTIAKRRVPGEVVRVSTQTQAQQTVVEEALTHEGVTVEHVAVGQYVDAIPPVRQEGDITILPVIDEEIVITKRFFLREEVHVRQTRTIANHVETITLRKQQIVVTRIPAELALAETTTGAGGASASRERTRNVPMPDETIVAVYDTPAHAELAVQDIKAAGVPDTAISLHSSADRVTGSTMTEEPREGFWSKLFGGEPDYDHSVYDRSVAAGSTVVTVKTPDTHIARVSEILESHQPIDIDERAASYGLASAAPMTEPTTGTTAAMSAPSTIGVGTAPAGYAVQTDAVRAEEGGTIQLAEEHLAVGKRLVNRGGTRIRRYVVETPVEENVTLHSETVTLDRRPVTDGRAVTDADFTDKTIEMVETAEELVVSKTAHVVEEVSLRKQASERVETVRDTVRKEEVEIEQIPGTTTATTAEPRVPGV